MTPPEVLASPSVSGRDTVIPWWMSEYREGTESCTARNGSGYGAIVAPRREYGQPCNVGVTTARNCGERGRIRWVCRGIVRHVARVYDVRGMRDKTRHVFDT